MKQLKMKKSYNQVLAVMLLVFVVMSGAVPVMASQGYQNDITVKEVQINSEKVFEESSKEEESAKTSEICVTESVYDMQNISGIVLTPGADESEMNFAWYTEGNTLKCEVQIAKESSSCLEEFPKDGVRTYTGTVCEAVDGFLSNKVTVTNLEQSTKYVYRLGDGISWSDTYGFTTGNRDEYSVLLVGDPQIGSSNVITDTEAWKNTMNKAVNKFPEASFMISAGDQVNKATSEKEYDGFFAPEELRSLPLATVQGNHDNSPNYIYHFNNPNSSSEYGITNSGGDYYFTYGDVLFIGINSNNISGESHAEFMRNAIKENPDSKWEIVTLHHSIYSSASHSTESAIVNRRMALFPVFDELGIDMVLMGHDHSYTRSYQMKGDQPVKNQTMDENGLAINPIGTLYITANSGSGSKYYSLKSIPEEYAAVRQQLRVPTFSNISVKGNSITISTYRADTMEMTDTYGLIKDPSYKTDYKIINPYETVDWKKFKQYKADFHAHSNESDGADEPAEMIEEHYKKGYDILALTDHNFTSTVWDRTDREKKVYLTSKRLEQINKGKGRMGRGMIGIPYSNEQSISEHLNTFWAPFNNEDGVTLEENIAECEQLGGISHINHPGRYTGGKNTEGEIGEVASKDLKTVAKYVDLFRKYPSCVGMEIINKKDGDSYSDRILWDSILKQTMPERPVWGFSNDDTHKLENTGYSYNMMLMPENTLENVRYSMENGTFYSVAKVAKRELGEEFTARGFAPYITSIIVDQQENSIEINAMNYQTIEWIADGKIISTEKKIDLNDYEEQISTYVRAQLKGKGGISFTQPFGIVGGYQPQPKLKKVILAADGELLTTGNSIKLDIKGQDEFYSDKELEDASISYKTDISDIISIDNTGIVKLLNKPKAGMAIKVWADVTLDGKTVSSNTVCISLEGESGLNYVAVRINNGSDDMEEDEDGNMDDGSSDLEIVKESSIQVIGTRFADVSIPKNAEIINAYIQFTVDEPNKSQDPFNVDIQAEAVSNSEAFKSEKYNISSRSRSETAIKWKDIPKWTREQVAGVEQRTPDLSALVQEIVNMEGWNEGNAISFILSGKGTRSAESYEGGGSKEAPSLHVIYKEKEQTMSSTMEIDSAKAYPDKSVSVAVYLKNVSDISGIKAKIKYDANKLIVNNVEFTEGFSNFAVNTTIPGDIYLNAIDADGISDEALKMAVLEFKVKSDVTAPDNIPLNIKLLQACDSQGKNVEMESIDGAISIVEPILPKVLDVSFNGECVVGKKLTASYTYSDEENKPENGTVFRWLIADSENGEYRTVLGEDNKALLLTKEMVDKFIKIEVTPSNGQQIGLPVRGDNGRNRVIRLGDVDKNGIVDYVDALKILQSLKGTILLDPQSMIGADVEGEDGVNGNDAIKILNVDIELTNLD